MPRSAARPGAVRRAITLATGASLLVLTVGVLPARAATLAAFPTSSSPATAVGLVDPQNAYADDGVVATFTLAKNDGVGQRYGDFGFDAIPVGSTIVSATAEIEFRFGSIPNDATVALQARVGGASSGTIATDSAGPTIDTKLTNTDLGITSRDQLLDGTFAIQVIAARSTAGPIALGFALDYVKVTVEYTVPNTTKPVVTVPVDITRPAASASGRIVTYTATATDDVDGAITPTCTPPSGSQFPIGTTTVTCTATDASGNTGSASFTITVTWQGPTLAPIGDQTVAEGATLDVPLSATDPDGDLLTFGLLQSYSFASLHDNGDGTAVLRLAPGFGDAGTYPANIVVSDGTFATGERIDIVVTDVPQPPVLAPIGDQTVAEGATRVVNISATDVDGDPLTFIAGPVLPSFATLVDNGDGTATLTLAPGFTDAGTYPVTIGVTDQDDTDLEGVQIIVTDTDAIAPVLTVPADVTKEATSAAGATVTFTATATDDVDGLLTPTCSPASESIFPLGTTTVTCTATDAAGNKGSASFGVTIVDTTPPAITTPEGGMPPDLTVKATGKDGAVVAFVLAATDGVDGELTPTCSPVSGSPFAVGTTTVTCSATDRAGNVAGITFSVTVTPFAVPTATTPPTATDTQAGAGGVGDTSTPILPWLVGMVFALGFLAVGIRHRRARGPSRLARR